MWVIGVPAKDWIKSGKVTFPKQLTTRDLLGRNHDQPSQPLFDAQRHPIMGQDEVYYFTFMDRNYLPNYKSYAKHIPNMTILFEPLGLWEYLEENGLMVASNLNWNREINSCDVIGMEIMGMRSDYPPALGTTPQMSLEKLTEHFMEAKKRLQAVGICAEPVLRCDRKWRAD